jgi:hypothetical protein
MSAPRPKTMLVPMGTFARGEWTFTKRVRVKVSAIVGPFVIHRRCAADKPGWTLTHKATRHAVVHGDTLADMRAAARQLLELPLDWTLSTLAEFRAQEVSPDTTRRLRLLFRRWPRA